MLGHQLGETRAPDGVVDGAPDRLDVEPLAGELLELGTRPASRSRLALKLAATSADTGRPGGDSAEQDLLPAQIAARRGGADEIGHGHADRPGIAGILAGHRLHHQRGVGDRARHRRDIGLVAEGVERLAVRDHAVALLQPDHAVAGGGNSRRSAAIGRNRKRRDAARHRHRRAAAGAAGGALRAPRIAGAAEQRRIGQAFAAEFRRRRLADQDRALARAALRLRRHPRSGTLSL